MRLGLVVLSTLVACSSGSAPRASRPASSVNLAGTVAWVDSPGRMDFPPPIPTTAPAGDAPPCTAGQLRIGAETHNGGGGNLDTIFSLINASSSTCVLKGFPRVVASQQGHSEVVAHDGGFFVGHDGVSANIAPGQSTELALETHANCPAKDTTSPSSSLAYGTETVQLPSGGQVVLHAELDILCGLDTGAFNVPQPAQEYAPLPWSGATARLELPPTARVGTTLDYVVDLTNDSARRVVLSPCPAYTEGIDAAGKQLISLNCTAGGQIRAHATVRYAMQLRIPTTTPRDRARLYWMIAGVPGVAASGYLIILGR